MRLILSVFGHLLDVSLDRLGDDFPDEPEESTVASGDLLPERPTPLGLGFTSPSMVPPWGYDDE